MAETNLGFSKIVSTPTPMGWSQAYNAGHLFAVFSLELPSMPEGESLTNTGKDLISTFESEFFTLESKDLESIKGALNTTSLKIPENISVSYVVCFLTDNILYLFATGGGKAILKRSEKIGTVLEASDEKEIKSASGYVKEEDIIVLQTKIFQKIIPQSSLASALDNVDPNKIAEELSPEVHEKTEGAAAALILSYKENPAPETPIESEENVQSSSEELENSQVSKSQESTENNPATASSESQNDISEAESTSEIQHQYQSTPSMSPTAAKVIDDIQSMNDENLPPITPIKTRRSLGNPFKKLPKSKKILLPIVLLLALIIIGGLILVFINRDSSDQKLFNSVLSEAQTNYDEGQSLKELNAPLAQQSFSEAENIINENLNEFDKDSDEYKALSSLLEKIKNELGGTTENTSLKEVEKSESKLLSYEIDNPKANYFTESETNVFFYDGSGISRIDKGNNEKEQVLKKTFNIGGIGVFGSNFYVLDKKSGILKYAPSGDKYNESEYFTDAPNLENAVAMGIDGSIYVLFKDGDVKKYTRGNEDEFAISGAPKALSNPTKIITNEDSDNIYILDNGNSRIAVFDKTGKFVTSYESGNLKSARDINIDEENKKILVLIENKIYQIDLK